MKATSGTDRFQARGIARLVVVTLGVWMAARASEPSAAAEEFTLGEIPPITLSSEGHDSSTRDGVKFDVFFNEGRKTNAVIYAINTGRRQLVLTPGKHRAILEDLVRRRFTVIVANFRDKRLPGLELERYVVRLTEHARAAADGVLRPSAPLKPPLANKNPAAASGFPLETAEQAAHTWPVGEVFDRASAFADRVLGLDH